MRVHLVFGTKCRRGVLNDAMPSRCEEIMRKVCEDFEAELKKSNGERDHVHLLAHYPPKDTVSKLVNSLKCVSAHRIRLGAPLAIVRQRIEQQKRPLEPAGQSSLGMRFLPGVNAEAFTQDHR